MNATRSYEGNSYSHEFSTAYGGFICEATGKIASHCWTNHDRKPRWRCNSCEYCKELGDALLSPAQRLRQLAKK